MSGQTPVGYASRNRRTEDGLLTPGHVPSRIRTAFREWNRASCVGHKGIGERELACNISSAYPQYGGEET